MPPRLLALPTVIVVLLFALQACSRERAVVAVCPDSAIIHGLDRMYGEDRPVARSPSCSRTSTAPAA
jgi:hypothetical protein